MPSPRPTRPATTVDSAAPDTGGAACSSGKGLGKGGPVRNLLSGLDSAHLGHPPVVASDPPAETH